MSVKFPFFGGGGFLGGVGSADFIFMGARIFLKKVSKSPTTRKESKVCQNRCSRTFSTLFRAGVSLSMPFEDFGARGSGDSCNWGLLS